MAKSDAFFIRAEVDSNGTTYTDADIDLGSFVNLGVSKSTLLRVHSVSVQIMDLNSVNPILKDADFATHWQLTTQDQTTIVSASDKSLVSCGSIQGKTGAYFTQDFSVNPQTWVKGYLIAVDTMFLAVDLSVLPDSGDVTVSIVMECTLENATQASSTALALSQQ